jgi:ABC-type cobalamin/Fe3+-siderophores transport system ATPase subunit
VRSGPFFLYFGQKDDELLACDTTELQRELLHLSQQETQLSRFDALNLVLIRRSPNQARRRRRASQSVTRAGSSDDHAYLAGETVV